MLFTCFEIHNLPDRQISNGRFCQGGIQRDGIRDSVIISLSFQRKPAGAFFERGVFFFCFCFCFFFQSPLASLVLPWIKLIPNATGSICDARLRSLDPSSILV